MMILDIVAPGVLLLSPDRSPGGGYINPLPPLYFFLLSFTTKTKGVQGTLKQATKKRMAGLPAPSFAF
jgi:hypothetical protein